MKYAADALVFAGTVLVCAGVGFWSVPASMVFAGLVLLVLGALGVRGRLAV